MKHVWDTAIALCSIEESCLRMKSLLANGSMLRGYTAKPMAEVSQVDVQRELKILKAHVAGLEARIFEVDDRPNLTCHACRKQVGPNHVGPCPHCGAPADRVYL